jgi:hypothetical protein
MSEYEKVPVTELETGTFWQYSFQINNSFCFTSEQAFLMAREAMDTINPLTFLAYCGQFETQRIQEIHFLPSVVFGDWGSIATTGHCFAHNPHSVHAEDAFGTSPAPPAFLYGRFPGNTGFAKLPDFTFSSILAAKSES